MKFPQIALFVAALIPGTSFAVNLMWTDTPFTNSNQISNVSSLAGGGALFAHNMGNGAAVTVNGVTFTPSGDATTAAIPNFRWGTNDNPNGDASVGYPTAQGVIGLSAADEVALLNPFTYGPREGNGMQFENLVIGQKYTAQFLVVDNRSSYTGRNLHFSINGTTWTGAGSVLSDYTSNTTSGSPFARLVETTFIADSATQAFRSGIQGTGEIQINAFQLRAVPEPSRAVLLLSGLGALMMSRRRGVR